MLLLSAIPTNAAGRKLAVVVGVGTYRANSGLPSLGKAPTNDAVVLSGVLREQGFTVFEMTHEAAKQDGQETMAPNIAYIRDQIAGPLGYPNLGADDTIVATLHGHGVQYEELDEQGRKILLLSCAYNERIAVPRRQDFYTTVTLWETNDNGYTDQRAQLNRTVDNAVGRFISAWKAANQTR